MDNSLILLLVAAFPVVVIFLFINSKDKEKESIQLLLKLFFAGMRSCILVLIINALIGEIFPILLIRDGLNSGELLINIFIGVALVEEFCKWLMTYRISYKSLEFNEAYDSIVYAVTVALGFAFFENIFYVFEYGVYAGIKRAFTAVPGHACFGVFMGYYLFLAKLNTKNNRIDLKNKNIALSILFPTILHGIYDYCLLAGNIILKIVVLLFIIVLYIKSYSKIKRISAITNKLHYKYKYCPRCGQQINERYCPICGQRNE